MSDSIRQFRPAVLIALGAAVLTGIIGIISLFAISPPMIAMKFHEPISLASGPVYDEILRELAGDRCMDLEWPLLCRFEWFAGISEQLMASPVTAQRLAFIGVGTVVASMVAFFSTYADTPARENLEVLKGRRIETGTYAARALRSAIRRSGKPTPEDLWLVPGVQLNEVSLGRNILVEGTQGSGKTSLLRAYVDQQLSAPKGRLFIFDAKGDMMAGLPVVDFIFIAPHDARSWALDIGREMINPMIAREFSVKCIPISKQDPMWAQATRAGLADIAMALHKRSGVNWTWTDLANAALSSTAEIREMLLGTNAKSAVLLNFGQDPEENRTVMSIMITLWVTVLTTIEPLAQVWADVPPSRRFTVRDWLTRGSRLPRTLLFQKSSDYPELSGIVGSFLAERVAAAGLNPSRRKKGTERLTQVLDEFPEASIDRLPQVLALGRELRITTIGTVQDLGQLSRLFGQEHGSVIEARFGIRIILRVEAGETAKRICDVWLGQRRIKRRRDATVDELAGGFTKPMETVWEATISPDFLSDELGVFETPKGKMIRLLVAGFPTIVIMDVPLTKWPDRREAHIPATWMQDARSDASSEDLSAS